MPAHHLIRQIVYLTLPSATMGLACYRPATSAATSARYVGSEPASRAREISRAEIDSVLWRVNDAYEIVRILRPGMLIPRDARARVDGASPMGETPGIRAYIDDLRASGVEALSTVPAVAVECIRRLSAAEAVLRFGGAHPSGAIVVTLRGPSSLNVRNPSPSACTSRR